jgi:hypothetical protein
MGLGNTNHLIAENGARVQVSPVTGWGPNNIFVTRRNGFVFFSADAVWNSTTRAAGQRINIVTLPAQYRPASPLYLAGMHIGTEVRCYIGLDGVCMMISSPAALAAGHLVFVHPATWPASY